MMLLALVLAGCEAEPLPSWDSKLAVDPGSIAGRVCNATGGGWLQGATVYTHVTDRDRILETRLVYTDRDGRWLIDDLPGGRMYDIFVYHGYVPLDDQAEEGVWLGDGTTVVLPEPYCVDPSVYNVAVVSGSRDALESVLHEIGLTEVDRVDGLDPSALLAFLSELDALRAYDFIFVNGGHEEDGIVTDAQVQENLRAYVEGGGSVFASEQAYDLVEQTWPEKLEFIGNDSLPDDAQVGAMGVVNAAVFDPNLAEWLNADHLEIGYTMSEWAPIESVDTESVTIHLKGNVSYSDGELSQAPLMVSFNSGDGQVAYSSFGMAENDSAELRKLMQYLFFGL